MLALMVAGAVLQVMGFVCEFAVMVDCFVTFLHCPKK